jgi:lipoprotein-releasing system permease protein
MLSHVIVESYSPEGFGDPRKLVEKIERIPKVKGAAPRVETLVLVQAFGQTTWSWLIGVDPAAERKVSRLAGYVEGEFRFDDGEGTEGLIVGVELGKYMNMFSGSLVTVHSLGKDGAKETVLPVMTKFKSGMYEYDSRQMYGPLATVRELLDMKDGATTIAVMVENFRTDAEEVKDRVARELEEEGLFRVQTWEERRANLLTAANLEKNVMAVILAFIIVVAAFSISGTLSMMVTHKTRTIGIMKSMGATRSGVTTIFLAVGGLMGLIGSVLGTAGGLLFLNRVNWLHDLVYRKTGVAVFPPNVYYLDAIPNEIDPVTIVLTCAVTIALSVGAAVLPAFRAARMDPVESLRYE